MVANLKSNTDRELDLLIDASTDFGDKGFTHRRCPRCGNEIVLKEAESSCVVMCASTGCIRTTFRGI